MSAAPDPTLLDHLRALRGRHDLRSWIVGFLGVPALGALGIGVTAWTAPQAVPVVALVVAVLVVVAVLGVALAASIHSLRAAEGVAQDLLSRLDALRDETVKDEITGLLNRRGLLLVGHQVLEAALRSGGGVHACAVHVTPVVQLGSTPLPLEELWTAREAEWAATAAALRAATRASDVVAREESGHFLVLGPGAGLHAQELERRVRVGLAQSRLQGGGDRVNRVSVEVGAATLAPWDEGGVEELILRAEQALAQRRDLRRSAPQHGWSRRRNDRQQPRTDRPGA
ncbi:MAG: diguanylate cyclase domain-containing protein [Janthinobacterium lividum]